MADENTTTPPASEAAEVSPEADVAIQPVTTADEPIQVAVSAAEVIQSASQMVEESSVPVAKKVTPPALPETRKHEDFHDMPHPHFRWNADVRVDGHEVYQGYVKDISMQGLHLYLDHNLQNAKFVKLHIHVPPLVVTEPHHVLEVTGKIASTVYDGDEESFRSGIVFQEFTLESDRSYLQSRLNEH